MPWDNFPFMFSLCDLWSFVSLLVLKHWTSFQWSQWMFFHRMQQTLLGSKSAADGAWLSCCDIRSEPHYSPANPESPSWLQGLSWIMQNNQQQEQPRSLLAVAPMWAVAAAWQDGLCLLSPSPVMISFLAKAAKGWSNACWGKYANVSFLSLDPR